MTKAGNGYKNTFFNQSEQLETKHRAVILSKESRQQ